MAIVTDNLRRVWAMPVFVFEELNNLDSIKLTAKLKPKIDPNGDIIISFEIVSDRTWRFYFLTAFITDPDTMITKPAQAWLENIAYTYDDSLPS